MRYDSGSIGEMSLLHGGVGFGNVAERVEKHFMWIRGLFVCWFLFGLVGLAQAQGIVYHQARPEVSPNPEEQHLQEALRHRFGLAGQALPTLDVALVLACRERAERILAMDEAGRAAERSRNVRAWLALHGVTDLQSTSAFGVAGDTASLSGELVRWAEGKIAERPSHVGVGVVRKDGQTAAVVVLLRRHVLLRPISNYFKTQGDVLVEGQTLLGARKPVIFLTNPNGFVEEFKPFATAIGGFSETIRLNMLGTWLVQVMVDTDLGRTAANQFPIYVGYKRQKKSFRASVETQGKKPDEIRTQVLSFINLARNASGRAGVKLIPALNEAAQAHARWMSESSLVSHVDADGNTPVERLKHFGIAADRYGENLGRNPSLSVLLDDTLESPSHRKVLMDERFNAVGLGLVYKTDTKEWFAVQLFATLAQSPIHVVVRYPDIPRSVFREINALRRNSRLPDLVADSTLTATVKGFLKAATVRNSLHEDKLRELIERAMNTDPNRKIGMYAVLPLADPADLQRFTGFVNGNWTHAGMQLLEIAGGGYLAVILLASGTPV